MTYNQALEKIHSLLTFGSRPGLERILILLEKLGNPQNKLKYIHVAGTNGKGSVCAMLSATLVEAGYKTGLFISPYITDFRERIQINNQMITEEALINAVEETFPIIEKLRDEGIIITEFEYVNALQFYIHSKENCDLVVLETGLGGLLDCTNTIPSPLCSVITTIGLDHTAILGDTIEEICTQKCGIIKKNSLAVTSSQETAAMQVIENTCKNLDIPLYKSETTEVKILSEDIEKTVFECNGITIELHLAGKHQIENAKTALTALFALIENNLLKISDEHISKGFSKAVNPARLELLSKNPIVLLDGAHNPNGIEALTEFIKKHFGDKKIICVMGMLADKDSESSLCLLESLFDEVYTVTIDNPRTLTAEQLAEKCRMHFDNVQHFETPEKAVKAAVEKAKSDDKAVIICGSLYLAGEIRPYFFQQDKI